MHNEIKQVTKITNDLMWFFTKPSLVLADCQKDRTHL